MIDRPLRPLFTEGTKTTPCDCAVLSADNRHRSLYACLVGASTALYFRTFLPPTPIAALRVGLIDVRYYLNANLLGLNEQSGLHLRWRVCEDGDLMRLKRVARMNGDPPDRK